MTPDVVSRRCLAQLHARERLIRFERERVKRLALYALGQHASFGYERNWVAGGVKHTVSMFPQRVA